MINNLKRNKFNEIMRNWKTIEYEIKKKYCLAEGYEPTFLIPDHINQYKKGKKLNAIIKYILKNISPNIIFTSVLLSPMEVQRFFFIIY